MADDSRETDQEKIDSAINELAERKNDVGTYKPATSTPQKRPSPSSTLELSSKRVNSSQHTSIDSSNGLNIRSVAEENDQNVNGENAACDSNNLHDESSVNCSQNDDSGKNHEDSVSRAIKSFMAKQKVYVESMDVRECLTSKQFCDEFSTEWIEMDNPGQPTNDSCKKFIDGSVKLYNDSFKICVISEFINSDALIKQMVDEMCHIEWQRKQMDLYEFHQTTDLSNVSNAKPALKQFYSLLQSKMLPWMKEITGLPLTRISASCSMYNYGDYLLVHDDLLSDRQIAFVFYLSPSCTEWSEEMGGALELFESDPLTGQPKYPIVRKFVPRNNQFVFFRVCKQSFHQVGEVTNLVYPRLTINGWFHGSKPNQFTDSSQEEDSNIETTNVVYQYPTDEDLILNEWINACYLRKRIKTRIQQHIEEKSEASLEMFLISEFFDLLVSEFKENTSLNWTLEGPANQRKFETLRFTPQSTGPLKDLYSLFTSESMFNLLHEYTELDLSGEHARHPTCSVQICRFTQGSYTLLGDSSTFSDSALDVILFFNARDGVGKITYLSPSQCINEYSTTVDTDATASSMDVSDIGISDISTSSTKKNSSKSLKVVKTAKRPAQPSDVSNSGKEMETSEDEAMKEITFGFCGKSAEMEAIKRNMAAINSACANVRDARRSQLYGGDESENDDSEYSEEEDFELAQEESLLTIHPKNNSLNLVYRLSGQTKFVKYISKNSLQPDEYIYILFATYKE